MLAEDVSPRTLLNNPIVKTWTQSVLVQEVYPLGYESLAYQAFLIAALVQHRPNAALVTCGRFKEMEELAANLEVWLGEERVTIFPWIETTAHSFTPDPDYLAQRDKTLHALLTYKASQQKPLVVLTLAEALKQSVPSPAWMQQQKILLKVGQSISLTQLQDQLAESGFLRVPRIDQPGQFAQRGGILDVFPYHLEHPLRIEFFGDEIDSMRSFSIPRWPHCWSRGSAASRRCRRRALIRKTPANGWRSFLPSARWTPSARSRARKPPPPGYWSTMSS